MFPSCYSKPKNGSQFKMSYTKVIFGVLVVYVLHTCWAIYGFVYTKPCEGAKGDHCVTSYLTTKPRLQLSFYSTLDPNEESAHRLLLKVDKFEIHTKFERKVTVSFPEMTKNGTIHAVVFVHKSGVSPWKDSKHVRLVTRLTFQMTPLAPAGSPGSTEEAHKGTEEPRLVSYWKSHITLNMMTEDFTFNNAAVPSDLRRYMKIVEDGKKDKKKLYLPLLLIDEMRSRLKDFNEINITTKAAPLMISYDTITLRKFRIWIHIQAVIFSLKHFVIWRCLSTFVIFLYLLEEKSSWLTLIPMGVAVLIELWKVSKVFALQPSFKDERDETERATEEYDAKAMKFLSYLMYPLCISGAMYSFLYLKNKSSWYSWTINSLVSGVYAFGFLSMVPQLFINYKLKSVGQLPISVLLYKGLNTFISDVFSGIITTPGPHQLACFRDDVVFLIYLYQRRIYPLNKSRGREYGASHRKKPKSKTHED
ncbi:cleft lip and palate transmembrane protein 1-like protein isoform X3 [Electrophorus electricus]|uniref:cleft lip and palate transmembrane protein 1-like protein isoform X3 n=1 Tax=Electrophorus electricus TaxID=8005 RepID=UPI000F09D25C|nr:cleft lip and palate transmembrane protein 1-like protein isoform X3 [Electrophorus electricus]